MIEVNGYVISENEFDMACMDLQRRARIQNLREQDVVAIANQLIDARLLLEEAGRNNVEIAETEIDQAIENIKQNFPSEEEFVAAMEKNGDTIEVLRGRVKDSMSLQKLINDKFVAEVTISDEDAEKYYLANQEKFVAPKQVKASHILFKPEAEEEAVKVRQLILDGADFVEMAKEYSECPSKQNGGDLGFFGKGMMVPEFETAAFAAEVGAITELVKTQFGYHIIKVEDLQEGGKQELAEVMEPLKGQMKSAAVNNNISKFAQTLRKSAKIAIDNAKVSARAAKQEESCGHEGCDC